MVITQEIPEEALVSEGWWRHQSEGKPWRSRGLGVYGRVLPITLGRLVETSQLTARRRWGGGVGVR